MDNMNLDELCIQFKLDTQNLLHEMDISILRGEYQHLLETGYPIDYRSINEASETWTKVKNFFNKWVEWFRNFFRMAKDRIIKTWYHFRAWLLDKEYKKEIAPKLEKGFPLFDKDREKHPFWPYIDPHGSGLLLKSIFGLRGSDDISKHIEKRIKRYTYIKLGDNAGPDLEGLPTNLVAELEHRLLTIFNRIEHTTRQPLYVDLADIKEYIEDDKRVRNIVDNIYKAYDTVRKDASRYMRGAYTDNDIAKAKEMKMRLHFASSILTAAIRATMEGARYMNAVISGCLEKAADADSEDIKKKTEEKPSPTNASFMYNSTYFDAIY